MNLTSSEEIIVSEERGRVVIVPAALIPPTPMQATNQSRSRYSLRMVSGGILQQFIRYEKHSTTIPPAIDLITIIFDGLSAYAQGAVDT
jgi:hypothetical protein